LRNRHRFIALGAVLALVALMVPVTAQAQTGTNYTVEVGAPLSQLPGESMRFFPSNLTVHDGDTITFVGGFHTATLLPSDNSLVGAARTDVQEWVDENTGLGDPYAFAELDPDDGTGALKGNNQAILGPGICGTPSTPCAFDGSQVVNSGLLFFSEEGFTVEVNGSAGDVFWAICLVHLNMRMKINVVAADQPASTQSGIDAAKATQVAEDTDLGSALHQKLRNRQSKHTTAGGQVVWDAWAGFDSDEVTLYAMYPKVLNLRRGDRVRWHFSQLVSEDHTVTFPLGRGLNIANAAFVPSCDPDGDEGTAADTPPTSEAPPFCADVSQLEFDIGPEFSLPAGNGRVTSKRDFENSAVRGANFPSDDPYTLRFPERSGDTPYKYVCLIHPFMRGRVFVRR